MTDNPKEQFSLINDQYIEKIYRFVYVKVDVREMAEDLTSKVFLKCWEAYQRGQEIKNPRAFLYQIARNTVTDYYRQKSRSQTVSIDRVVEIRDDRTSPYESAVMGADMEAVKTAILKLKKEYQDVLILYYLEDMPAEEIAVIVSKSAGNVRVMIHRGLEALRDELT